MIYLRYLQLYWLLLRVILGKEPPPRKPRGDIRNFARTFYVTYHLSKTRKAAGWS